MRLTISVVLLFLANLLVAQGITFHADNWADAVELARKENKLLFIDAYTTWCAPCKIMDEYVFTHEFGGDQYNPNYINVKLDMEKNMGPLIGSRYGVTSYPTFLYATWDGTLIHKSVGYMNIEKLVSEGQKALEPYRLERALRDRYDLGDRSADFLYHLTYYRLDKNDPTYRELIPLYMETQSDWNTKANMKYIFDFVDDFDSKMFLHMSQNKIAYGEVVGNDEFNQKFKDFIDVAMKNGGQPLSLERREQIYKVAYPRIADQMMTDFKMDYYRDIGDDEKYAETAFYYYQTYASDDQEGIRHDLPLFEKYLTSDEAQTFIRRVNEEIAREQNSPAGMLTLARYQLSDLNFEQAKELGKQAKKLAKSLKEDQKPYKAFLKEVKSLQKSVK
jgi:thiol-disulfide isomerase/thioredoxin